MAVVINTNVDSIKIQHNLTDATNNLSTAMQRMSTGLKVLTAKDDAAGSVIASRMLVQLNGNQICQNNVQNGDAMLATAEGNIDVVLDNVSRIRDLTLQAKNGTYSKEEIQAMQDEVAERIAEIDRVSENSKYSQLYLFEDEGMKANGVTFQVGANSSEDNTIHADASLFQSVKFNAITGRDGETVLAKSYVPDETLIGEVIADNSVSPAADNCFVQVDKSEALDENGELKTGYKAICSIVPDKTTDTKIGSLGDVIYVKETAKTDAAAAGETALDLTNTSYAEITDATDVTVTGLDLTTLDPEGFSLAIDNLDAAIDNLTARKSIIGSAQNRLESALTTLTTQYENLSSAKSIIMDADVASEASNFTQQSILQQVSTSLLAQANQAPSIALSLV